MPINKVASPILGEKLRLLRKARGFKSVVELAEKMNNKYSYSAISRRESGVLKIDEEYIEDFSSALSLDAEEKNSLLVSMRVNGLRKQEQLDRSISEWAQLSVSAKAYDGYNAAVVGRYLQSIDYAEALLKSVGVSMSKEDVLKRAKGIEVLISGSDKKFRLLVHENALYFMVGDGGVMIGQLMKLLNFVDLTSLEFRILPRAIELSISTVTGFNIIDHAYCFSDSRIDCSITDDTATVGRFQADFDTMWNHAVIGAKRSTLIKKAIAYYKGL